MLWRTFFCTPATYSSLLALYGTPPTAPAAAVHYLFNTDDSTLCDALGAGVRSALTLYIASNSYIRYDSKLLNRWGRDITHTDSFCVVSWISSCRCRCRWLLFW